MPDDISLFLMICMLSIILFFIIVFESLIVIEITNFMNGKNLRKYNFHSIIIIAPMLLVLKSRAIMSIEHLYLNHKVLFSYFSDFSRCKTEPSAKSNVTNNRGNP